MFKKSLLLSLLTISSISMFSEEPTDQATEAQLQSGTNNAEQTKIDTSISPDSSTLATETPNSSTLAAKTKAFVMKHKGKLAATAVLVPILIGSGYYLFDYYKTQKTIAQLTIAQLTAEKNYIKIKIRAAQWLISRNLPEDQPYMYYYHRLVLNLMHTEAYINETLQKISPIATT